MSNRARLFLVNWLLFTLISVGGIKYGRWSEHKWVDRWWIQYIAEHPPQLRCYKTDDKGCWLEIQSDTAIKVEPEVSSALKFTCVPHWDGKLLECLSREAEMPPVLHHDKIVVGKLGTGTSSTITIEGNIFFASPCESNNFPYWNPETKACQNVPYCPKSGCAPIPAEHP